MTFRNEGFYLNAKTAKQRKIITAATKLFTELGFDQASMQKIADEAQIGVATLFRYFPKKELLIVEVIESVIEEMVPHFEEIDQSKLTGLQKMDAILEAYIDYLTTAKRDAVILLESFDYYAAFHTMEQPLMEQIEASYTKIGRTLNRAIQLGFEDGTIGFSPEKAINADIIMNLFGTAIKKHSFNMLLENGIFPIPDKVQLSLVKSLIINYLAKNK